MIVDLRRVAGQHQLRPLADAARDRLHLVRRQVLRLVDDEDDVRQAAAADVGQRHDVELLGLHQLVHLLLAFLAVRAVAGVEQVRGDVYSRTLRLPHGHGTLDLETDLVAGAHDGTTAPRRHEG